MRPTTGIPAETTQPSVPAAVVIPFCQRNKSENESFTAELRNKFHGFFHASMDEHKTCLKASFQKACDRIKSFGEKKPSTNYSEGPVPASTPVVAK